MTSLESICACIHANIFYKVSQIRCSPLDFGNGNDGNVANLEEI